MCRSIYISIYTFQLSIVVNNIFSRKDLVLCNSHQSVRVDCVVHASMTLNILLVDVVTGPFNYDY